MSNKSRRDGEYSEKISLVNWTKITALLYRNARLRRIEIVAPVW